MEYLINLHKINPIYAKINIHASNECAFRLACLNGYLHIVKYLINLYKIRQSREPTYAKINIHENDEEGFRWTCRDGYIHIIKYLVKLYKKSTYAKINIHANNEEGFRSACRNGHKHIIKYLLSCGSYYSNNYKCIIIL